MSFDSMTAAYDPETGEFIYPDPPTKEEKRILFGVDFYIAAQKIEKINWPSLTWRLDSAIGFSVNIFDLHRTFFTRTKPGRNNGTYTDNFVKLIYTVQDGNSLYFPKLIIKTHQIRDEFIMVQGIDLVSEILQDEVTLSPYVCHEYLKRTGNATWQSNLLTGDWDAENSLIFVNDLIYSGSATFNDETRILTFADTLPRESIVLLVNPLSTNWIISDFFSQVSSDFELENNLTDFLVYSNINIIQRTPIDFLKEFLEATVGEYYIIENATHDGLKLVLQEKSYTAEASKYMPPGLFKKGGPQYSHTEIKRFNTVRIKRLSLVPEVIKSTPDLVISETISEGDPKEIDFEYTAVKDSIELQKAHWVEDGGISPEPVIEEHVNEDTIGGVAVCDGIKISAEVTKEHTNALAETVATPDSAYTLSVKYEAYQDSDSVFVDGLDVLVIDQDHEALYGTKEAKFDVVNNMIETEDMAEAIGTETIRESAKNQDFSITMAFFEDIKPSDFHRTSMEEVLNAERKVEEINITDVLRLKYEAVPGDIYEPEI